MLDRLLRRLATGALMFGVGSTLFQSSIYNVDGGEAAVIFDRIGGVKDKVIGEGTHFRVPWLQTPIVYDIRTRPKAITTQTGTKDLQTVSITLRVLHRPRVESLPIIYNSLGLDYEERVLPSIGNEVMKAVVAQYNAEELITRRESISRQIRSLLTQRANDFNILLEDISLTHLAFGKEFTVAVENKQVAQQEAERSKFIVAKAEQEKLAAIIRAEGESQAAKLISEAMKAGPGLVELRKIETAREIAVLLARSRNITYIPQGGNMLLNLPASG